MDRDRTRRESLAQGGTRRHGLRRRRRSHRGTGDRRVTALPRRPDRPRRRRSATRLVEAAALPEDRRREHGAAPHVREEPGGHHPGARQLPEGAPHRNGRRRRASDVTVRRAGAARRRRSRRHGHGHDPPAGRAGPDLLQPDREGRQAARDGRPHPPGRSRGGRAGGRAAGGAEGGRHGGRLRHGGPHARRRDPEEPDRLLRQRPHGRLPERRGPGRRSSARPTRS